MKRMKQYAMSIRCYFQGKDNYTQHYPMLPLIDIQKWIECYEFTHPNVESVTVKIWLHDKEVQHEVDE